MTHKMFTKITDWQRETFPHSTPLSRVRHLLTEVKELKFELQQQQHLPTDEEAVLSEFADCFILLFGAAESYGMDYSEICECIHRKMKINKERKWNKPDKHGVVNHIK